MAERAIQSFKRHYTSMQLDKFDAMQDRLNVWLLAYRNTKHSSTGRTPAELFIGRKLCTVLDRLKPDAKNNMHKSQVMQKFCHDRYARALEFFLGDSVWVYDNLRNDWTAGVIKRQTGPLSYTVEVGGVDLRKHADHLRVKHDTSLSSHDYSMPDGSRCIDKNKHSIQIPTYIKTPAVDDVTSGDTNEAAGGVTGTQGEDWAQGDMARSDSADEAVGDARAEAEAEPRRSTRVRRAPQRFGFS